MPVFAVSSQCARLVQESDNGGKRLVVLNSKVVTRLEDIHPQEALRRRPFCFVKNLVLAMIFYSSFEKYPEPPFFVLTICEQL